MKFEIRASGAFSAKENMISGRAIVFNSLSADLSGGFGDTRMFEIIKPGAVDLRDNPDIPCLMGHDWSKLLARTGSKTLNLSVDDQGLGYTFEVPNTTAGNDARELIKRGDVAGASFGFTVPDGGDNWIVQGDGSVLREISKLSLREISLTAFPAYPATTADVRSLDEIRKLAGEVKQRVAAGGRGAELALMQLQAELWGWG